MMNKVQNIISFEKKTSYRNKVSVYIFKDPGKVLPAKSDEVLSKWRKF